MPHPSDKTELEKRMIAWIDRRYQAHAARDLGDYIFANYLFYAFDSAEIDFAYTFSRDILGYLAGEDNLAGLVDYCVLATKRYTYRRNQFINFTGFYDELLYAEYRRFLVQLRELLQEAASPESFTGGYARVLREHHEKLRLVLSSYCVAYDHGDLADNPLLGTVPCEEYSARFQLRLLAVDMAQLEEPVLDLGCGASGSLVKFLRRQGYAAFGVDRLAPAGPYFYQQDWFQFDYRSQAWGTILAHQSLSTHFIYNHLRNPALAEAYARLYMKILTGLKPGGAFCYAPGLPFFEEHLEAAGLYDLSKTTISTNNTLGIGEIFYATRINRRPTTVKEYS